MHVNLILGLIFVLALWWLLRDFRARKKSGQADPGEILKDELEKRRAAQEKSRRASERLTLVKAQHLAKIMAALEEMEAAMQDNSNFMQATLMPDEVILTLNYKDKSEDFCLKWNIKDFDLELLAGNAVLSEVSGDYTIRLPKGRVLHEPDFASFTRTLSGLIADRLA